MSLIGQLICASTRCSEKNDLKSWEVNFAYIEDGEKKNALVKIRLCPKCSGKLNYKNRHQEVNREQKHENRKRKSYEGWSERDQSDATESHDNVGSKKKKISEKSATSSQREVPRSSATDRTEEFDEYFTGLFD
ncbi:11233_t:CDS:2 [Acaulospora colombiana]|uniref:11233_t:CDS:1 n=1 Tax=Acaulospora colombiana TaxID=27376 RepID=A0ACA9K1W6_9GLOM|nr:11233_t:CDS:2 [Acaulospora colombiana]